MTPPLRPGERIDQLYANDISIIQASDVFSFSLDAVLLAHFCSPILKSTGKIADLCAGNGAVGLFLSAKTTAHITAVELQERLADMAIRSVLLNNLESQIDVITYDVCDVFSVLKKDSFDTVCVNPPYFALTPNSVQNPNRHLALARHELAIKLEDVLEAMSGLLKQNGKGYMVHRPDRLDEILAIASKKRLAVKKVWLIYPKAGKDANTVLLEFIKDGHKNGVKFIEPLVVYGENGKYSPQVRHMLYGNTSQQ